jgi:hypothetical protein
VDSVPDPLLLRKLVAPGIEPGTCGSVDMNSDHTKKNSPTIDLHVCYYVTIVYTY